MFTLKRKERGKTIKELSNSMVSLDMSCAAVEAASCEHRMSLVCSVHSVHQDMACNLIMAFSALMQQ